MIINKTKRGFTLIELMVVISIISLLSSIVLASVKSARDRANETYVIQTVRSIQTGLELFRTEKGYYPVLDSLSGGGNSYFDAQSGTSNSTTTGDFLNFTKYINLNNALNPKKLPNGVTIRYLHNKPTDYEGVIGLYVCDSLSTNNYTTFLNDRYVILVVFPQTSNYKNLTNMNDVVYKRSTNIVDTLLPAPSGNGYINPGDMTACFSNEKQ